MSTKDDEDKLTKLLKTGENVKNVTLEDCCLTIWCLNQMFHQFPNLEAVTFTKTELDVTKQSHENCEKSNLIAVSIFDCGSCYKDIIDGLQNAKKITDLTLHEVDEYQQIKLFIDQQEDLKYFSINNASFFDTSCIKFQVQLKGFKFHSVNITEHIDQIQDQFQNFLQFIKNQEKLEKVSFELLYFEQNSKNSHSYNENFPDKHNSCKRNIEKYLEQSLEHIAKSMTLKELKINLMRPENFLSYCKRMKMCNEHVDYFSLSFKEQESEEYRLTQRLIDFIVKVFPKLKKLKIDFENCENPKQFGSKIFPKISYSKFEHLEELIFDQVRLVDFPDIPESIKTLRLRFDSKKVVDFKDLKCKLLIILANGKNLETLEIISESSKFSESNRSEIADLLKANIHLTSILNLDSSIRADILKQ